ncbi:MAG TPA: iron chelate uptake ABC transporter family permease subunit [Capillimicrobium sp.]|nr:iron chelate uptake ABC transporter family permease subunit [Capillimicrobium sp.]
MTGGRVVVRRGPVSLRVDLRVALALAAVSAGVLAALVASVSVGEFGIPIGDVVATLAGAGDQATEFIVLDLRLPRALVAVLSGAALGLAGAIFQAATRNPLVSPDVIGVSGGAAVAAVAVIVFSSTASAVAVPLAALAGAIAAGAGLYALAWRGGVDGLRLVLVGIGVAALAQAGVWYVMTQGRIFEVAEAYLWLIGSVNGRGWEHVWPLAATLAVLAPAIVATGRRLDALALGDDLARSLGVAVERSRLLLLATAVVLTAVAVAATGPIGFVAFVAPHLARRMRPGVSAQGLLPLAAGCGALLVVISDLAGRLAFAPTELPVGIVTSVLAAPYFLVLLRRASRVGVAG